MINYCIDLAEYNAEYFMDPAECYIEIYISFMSMFGLYNVF